MDILSIAKSVGGAALNMVMPGAGTAVVGLVNEFLPDNKKLPSSATGHDVQHAVASLPPDQRAAIMSRQIDVDLAEVNRAADVQRAMLMSDATTPHTTRPKIVYQSFQIVAAISMIVISLWAYAVSTGQTDLVKAVMDGWPFVLGVIGPFVALLRSYFGILKVEHSNKIASITGAPQPVPGMAGTISSIVGALRGGR